MKSTLHFRHVWRLLSDGNSELKVLTLQQWFECEGWENPIFLSKGGQWQDVEVSHKEGKEGPENY